MKNRLMICAGIGILIAAGWMFVALLVIAAGASPTRKIIWRIGYVIYPAMFIHVHVLLGFLLNGLIYAVIGLIVGVIWREFRKHCDIQ